MNLKSIDGTIFDQNYLKQIIQIKMIRTVILIMLFSIVSCNSDDSQDTEFNLPQKWKLNGINVSLSGEFISVENLEYDEEYEFLSDITFAKLRVENQESIQSSGEFSLSKSEDAYQLILTHSTGSGIIQNCDNTNVEILTADLNLDSFINISSSSCDLPTFIYSKEN